MDGSEAKYLIGRGPDDYEVEDRNRVVERLADEELAHHRRRVGVGVHYHPEARLDGRAILVVVFLVPVHAQPEARLDGLLLSISVAANDRPYCAPWRHPVEPLQRMLLHDGAVGRYDREDRLAGAVGRRAQQ